MHTLRVIGKKSFFKSLNFFVKMKTFHWGSISTKKHPVAQNVSQFLIFVIRLTKVRFLSYILLLWSSWRSSWYVDGWKISFSIRFSSHWVGLVTVSWTGTTRRLCSRDIITYVVGHIKKYCYKRWKAEYSKLENFDHAQNCTNWWSCPFRSCNVNILKTLLSYSELF